MNLRLLYRAILLAFAFTGQVAAQDSSVANVAIEPHLTYKPDLEFPRKALGASVTAKLFVKVLVGKDGAPIKTEILKREPDIAFLFDDDSRRFCMKCRFSPARDSVGNPVMVWVTMPLRFEIKNYRPPQCKELAEPKYPDEARELGMEGWVGLAVFVNDQGKPQRDPMIILSREPATSTVFDDAAKEVRLTVTIRDWEFGRGSCGWLVLH